MRDLYEDDPIEAATAALRAELAEAHTKIQQMLTITKLVERSHALAIEKGWYETWPDNFKTKRHAVNVPEKLVLIHSEISEALESFREFGWLRRLEDGERFAELWLAESGKPEGFVVELADAVIRIADLCGALGLDLAKAIELKHTYNATRPYRHGGKRA